MSGYKVSLLKKKLTHLCGSNNPDNKVIISTLEVLINYLRGLPPIDLDDVVIEVINFLPNNDLRVKQLVYFCLSLYSKLDSEIIFHASNSVMNDLSNPNPMIRAACASFLPYLKGSDQFGITNHKAMLSLLQDKSVKVRKAAIEGVMKILKSILLKENQGSLPFIPNLVSLIERDDSPVVVVQGLFCITMCDINLVAQPILFKLLKKAKNLSIDLINIILYCAYKALKVDQMNINKRLSLMNGIESLKSRDFGDDVLIQTFRLQLVLSSDLDVNKIAVKKLITSLVKLYDTSPQQLKVLYISCLITISYTSQEAIKEVLSSNINRFYVFHGDIDQLKVKKIELLKICIDENNSAHIFKLLKSYFYMKADKQITRLAFEVLKRLYKYLPELCLQMVHTTLYSEYPLVLEESIKCISYFFMKKLHKKEEINFENIFKQLINAWPKITSSHSKNSCMWLLSKNNQENLCDSIKEIFSVEIKSNSLKLDQESQTILLISTVRLLLKWPDYFHECFKNIFLLISNGLIKDLAKLYLILLKNNQDYLKKLLDSYQFSDVYEDQTVVTKTHLQDFCSLQHLSYRI